MLVHEPFLALEVVHGIAHQRMERFINALSAGTVDVIAELIDQCHQLPVLGINFREARFKKTAPFKRIHAGSPLLLYQLPAQTHQQDADASIVPKTWCVGWGAKDDPHANSVFKRHCGSA
jgi:hypothetical protein